MRIFFVKITFSFLKNRKNAILLPLGEILRLRGGQADEQGGVVRLDLRLVRRATARDRAAPLAAMDDDVAAPRIGLDADRAHQPAAAIRPVAGQDVDVPRAEAEGAVVARGVAEGKDLSAAGKADEALVVFGEAFGFQLVHGCRITAFR